MRRKGQLDTGSEKVAEAQVAQVIWFPGCIKEVVPGIGGSIHKWLWLYDCCKVSRHLLEDG